MISASLGEIVQSFHRIGYSFPAEAYNFPFLFWSLGMAIGIVFRAVPKRDKHRWEFRDSERSTSFFNGKSHPTPIITQDRDDGREDNHHDEINGMGYLGLRTAPEDKDDLENKEDDRKL